MARYLSNTAIEAKKIRAELKAAFPSVKFSVHTHNYSGGSSIRIKWDDVPIVDEVRAIAGKYEDISRDERTGEILSGGNTYIFADREISAEYRAKVEAYMTAHGINYSRDDWEYGRNFGRAEKGMIADEAAKAEPVEESTSAAANPQPIGVTVTLNEEKNGVEIKFDSKPDAGIIAMLRENGYRWSGRLGIWWSKQTPERVTLAHAIQDMYTPATAGNIDTMEVGTTQQMLPADETTNVVEADPYATPDYAPNCHFKAWNMPEDKIASVLDSACVDYDISGGKFIVRGATREQYTTIVDVNQTNGAIIFADGDTPAPVQVERVPVTVSQIGGWRDSFMLARDALDNVRDEITRRYPQLTTGDYVYKVDKLGYDAKYVEPSQPRTYAEGERVPMLRIMFTWSESGTITGGDIFDTWHDAQRLIDRAYAEHVREYGGPDEDGAEGYYKTGFVVCYADGYTYEGRIDINGKDCNLAEHIRDHMRFYAGLWHPSHMTDERYHAYIANIDTAEYAAWLQRYTLEDTPVTPTPPTNSNKRDNAKRGATIIDFATKQRERAEAAAEAKAANAYIDYLTRDILPMMTTDDMQRLARCDRDTMGAELMRIVLEHRLEGMKR